MSQSRSLLRIELVFDRECPNVEEARRRIRAALLEVGAEPCWTEWDREGDATPEIFKRYGSPTVFVNGRDVGDGANGMVQASANSCRIYLNDDEVSGAPSARLIANAIRLVGTQ